jgi:hypothetical protein
MTPAYQGKPFPQAIPPPPEIALYFTDAVILLPSEY